MESLKQEERAYLASELESGEQYKVENAFRGRFFKDEITSYSFIDQIDGTG